MFALQQAYSENGTFGTQLNGAATISVVKPLFAVLVKYYLKEKQSVQIQSILGLLQELAAYQPLLPVLAVHRDKHNST